MNLSNKKILVTGGHGFLGKHLVQLLKERGISEEQLCVPTSKDCDLRDRKQIETLFASFAPDVVFHLAAKKGGMGYYKEHPGTLFYDNAMMGILLMDVAQKNNVEKMIITGTGIAYPQEASIPQKEEDFWKGSPHPVGAPFAIASKLLLTQAQAYRKEYDFNAVYVILSSIYGPEDNFDPEVAQVLPALIKRFDTTIKEKKKSISIWGSGKASREFLFVNDACEALIAVAERYDQPEPLNIGTGEGTPIKVLAETIAKEFDFTGEIVWDTSKPEGQLKRCFDVSRCKKELEFTPKTSIEEGLKETIQWYRQHEAS